MRITLLNEEIMDAEAYLEKYLYDFVRSTDEKNVFEVDSLGVPLEDVVYADGYKNTYGEPISRLRERDDLEVKELARILMVPPNIIKNVENGVGWLSDSQLAITSMVFNVSVDALKEGIIRQTPSEEEIQQSLQSMHEDILEVKEKIEQLMNVFPEGNRFDVKFMTVDYLDDLYAFRIYDKKIGTFVTDSNGKPVQFDFANEAIDEAARLEFELAKDYEITAVKNQLFLYDKTQLDSVGDYLLLGTIDIDTEDIQVTNAGAYPGIERIVTEKLNEAVEQYNQEKVTAIKNKEKHDNEIVQKMIQEDVSVEGFRKGKTGIIVEYSLGEFRSTAPVLQKPDTKQLYFTFDKYEYQFKTLDKLLYNHFLQEQDYKEKHQSNEVTPKM